MKNAIVQLITVFILITGNLSAQFVPAGNINYPVSPTISGDEAAGTVSNLEEIEYTPMAFVNAVNSTQSGDWNAPGTWDCGCVPNLQDDVNILAGHTITQNLNVQVANLNIEADGELVVNSGGLIFEITGDWINSGQFTASDGTVLFNGTTDQNIIGFSTFYNLGLTGSQLVQIVSDVRVEKVLNITGSTLQTNGRLTLASDGLQTASLDKMTTGTIDGAITVEYNAYPANTGWLTLSAPFTDATFEEWNDDLVTTGFVGADYPAYSFISIQYYDETGDDVSFVGITDVEDLAEVGRGYYLYANSGSYAIDLQGEPQVGDVDFPISYTSTGNQLDDGLNVLGNPYPCAINWEEDGAWTKSNVNSALYIWDVSQRQFRVYIHGYGINGGSPIIKSGEAFWVQSNAPDPVLGITENAKKLDWTSTTNSTTDFLMISMEGNGTTDELIVAFAEESTESYSPAEDAFKFYSDAQVPNICTKSDDDIILAVNCMPLGTGNKDIPLVVHSPNGGDFVLSIVDLPTLEFDACMVLEDLVTGDMYDLAVTDTISFSTDPVEEEVRFMIHIGGLMSVEETNISCFGSADGEVIAMGTGDGPWDYVITDSEDQEIASSTSVDAAEVFENLTTGTYTMTVINNDYCPSLSHIFEISEPDSLYIESYTVSGIDCDESNTGSITVSGAGGTGNLDYLWSTSDVGMTVSDLPPGSHSVIIMDEAGCTTGETFVIESAPTVEAMFDTDNQVIDLINGQATVTFSNLSENSTNYLWDFGDGNNSSDENPYHVYTLPGVYIVELVASNDQCTDTYQVVIQVQEVIISVEESEFTKGINLFYYNNELQIQFDFNAAYNVTIDGYNTLGQRIIDPITNTFSTEKVQLAVNHRVPVGIITISNNDTGEFKTYKIIH